jgi:hypothetical protein
VAPYHDSRRCTLNPRPFPLSSCPNYVSLPLVDNPWPCKRHREGGWDVGFSTERLVVSPLRGGSELSLCIGQREDGEKDEGDDESGEEGDMGTVRVGKRGRVRRLRRRIGTTGIKGAGFGGDPDEVGNGDGDGQGESLKAGSRTSSWSSFGSGKCIVM